MPSIYYFLVWLTLARAPPRSRAEYVWVRREATRPLAPHMLRRRTTEKRKKPLETALQHEVGLNAPALKSVKKSAVGKRLAVYWPMDDAWYTGVRN